MFRRALNRIHGCAVDSFSMQSIMAHLYIRFLCGNFLILLDVIERIQPQQNKAARAKRYKKMQA